MGRVLQLVRIGEYCEVAEPLELGIDGLRSAGG